MALTEQRFTDESAEAEITRVTEYIACLQAYIEELQPLVEITGVDFDRAARNKIRKQITNATTYILTLFLLRDGTGIGYSDEQVDAVEDLVVTAEEYTDILAEILKALRLKIKPFGERLEG